MPKKPTKETRAKAEIFFNAKEAGMKREDALEVAGYSRKNGCVEQTQAYRQVVASVEKEREIMQSEPGFRMRDIAGRFKARATNSDVSANAQNEADKALLGMLDYMPSKKVDIKTMGMLVEFKDVSMADLLEMRERRIAELSDE